jgi:hypothetical protein
MMVVNKVESMNAAMRVCSVVITGFLAGASSVALAQAPAAGPIVKPASVAKRAGAAPPASAKAAKTAGGNKVTISTANSAADDDSFWVEKLDVDGDGDVEDTNLVWDDEDGVLFAYSVAAFACRNGGTATAELMVATNAAGNSRGRPAGSGFWLADLDKGECGAEAAALWGCKFDASGTETACGFAALDEKNDDLIMAATN